MGRPSLLAGREACSRCHGTTYRRKRVERTGTSRATSVIVCARCCPPIGGPRCRTCRGDDWRRRPDGKRVCRHCSYRREQESRRRRRRVQWLGGADAMAEVERALEGARTLPAGSSTGSRFVPFPRKSV